MYPMIIEVPIQRDNVVNMWLRVNMCTCFQVQTAEF